MNILSDSDQKIINMMQRFNSNILKDLFNLVFPACCISCSEPLPEKRFIICQACYNRLESINQQQIDAFMERITEKHFDEIIILFHFSPLFQKLMHFFKYEGFFQITDYFAMSIQQKIKRNTYDIISSVPLHASKKRERGFNQSEILARKVALQMGIEWIEVLERTRYTNSQTKLSRAQRKENMLDAFKFKNNVENKRLLLIDDVITTGATLNECARILKNAGAYKIDILAMATPVDILQTKAQHEFLPY